MAQEEYSRIHIDGDLRTELTLQQSPEGNSQVYSNVMASSVVTPREPLLIYPKKICDFQRFRMLFVGILLYIVSSTQGVHSIFGTLQMQIFYMYDAKMMMTVYLVGQVFGMFVLPFGALYDWFGPRVVVALGVVLTAIGHLLFALIFSGHIEHSVAKSSVSYAVMCWGSYALQVAVMPSVLTHMPRDRGQPTGLLETFSGLGSSFIACIFRGFFNNHFDNIMWFMFALTLFFGGIGIWYIEDAPYVATRWQQRRHIPLKKYLIRNRYMAQFVPKRRFYILSAILILVNFYLTIQAVIAGYKKETMTQGQYRGVAIGSIIVVCLTIVLLVPLHALDGHSNQDDEIFSAAKQREKEIVRLHGPGFGEALENIEANETRSAETGDYYYRNNKNFHRSQNKKESHVPDTVENDPVDQNDAAEERSDNSNCIKASTDISQTHYATVGQERPLVEVKLSTLDIENNAVQETTRANENFEQPPDNVERQVTDMNAGPGEMLEVSVITRKKSTYNNPVFLRINVCGELFVTPVYETSFLQSLTYLDLWMIFYTTVVVWGIGLTMTGNWNIYVMVSARFEGLEYKYYILFASMSGLATSGGRVSLGLYEAVLQKIRERYGVVLVPTCIYPIISIGFFISMIFWIALPNGKSLILPYLLGPTFLGMSTSVTMYILGTIFDRDLGMHYGFCFLGGAVGMILFYYLSWFLIGDHPFILSKEVGRVYLPERKSMSKTVGIYMALALSSIFSSYVVHWRYKNLVEGKLKHRRVIFRTIRRLLANNNSSKPAALSV